MKGHSGRNLLQHLRLVVHVDSWQVFPIYIMSEAQMKKKFLFVSSKDSLISKTSRTTVTVLFFQQNYLTAKFLQKVSSSIFGCFSLIATIFLPSSTEKSRQRSLPTYFSRIK